MLIVDHDLRLIMRLCERIHVLAEGRTICEGAPEAVRSDRGVIEAYLGKAAGEPPAAAAERTGAVGAASDAAPHSGSGPAAQDA